MADYGNYFTNNSNDYYYTTNGHNYDDSDWVIVKPTATKYTTGCSTYIVGWPGGSEFVGNNCNTYVHTNLDLYTRGGCYNYYSYINDKNEYVAYYAWNENSNKKGSITGSFTCYPFNDPNSSKLVEPTGLDDTSHGVSPYSNSNNNALTRTSLEVKGTTYTAGYRRQKVKYFPEIHRNIVSYDNGNLTSNGNFNTPEDRNTLVGHLNYDNSYVSQHETIIEERYDALQTFFNIQDPYAILNVSITNHDNVKSSSPIFCSLTNNKSEYRINHSYSYNPYMNSATWNNTNYLSFTYNTLPTYPKSLVFTYDSNWDSVSYDGGSVNVEAKAFYNNSYDRFTTSTANDDGFSSYKRYVDVTYSVGIYNSSTTPTGINSYTFRIWQPGSKLGISYSWSIDTNPSWAHLSTTTGSKTTVSFDDQGDTKGAISGKLVIDCATTGTSENTYNGTMSGVTFTDKDNKSDRSCTIRQNMKVTNCSAQNITPKDSNGQPYQIVTFKQKAGVWETPKFNITVYVTQDGKTNTPTTDALNYEYPTFTIGSQTFTPTNGNAISVSGSGWPWVLGTTSKAFSVKYPKIEDIYTRSKCNGSASCSIESGTIIHGGGSKTITVTPNITFEKKRYEGFSGRKWTLKCKSINPTVALDNKLSGFDDVQFTMIGKDKWGYGSGTVKFSLSGVTTSSSPFSSDVIERTIVASDSRSNETLNANTNDLLKKTFTITAAPNNKVSGSWSASASDGKINISSTSKNKASRSVDWSISSSVSEDGTVTMSGNNGTLTQDADTWVGTITVTGTGTGLSSCTKTITYPANTAGNATASGSYSLVGAVRRHLTGKGSMTCSGYWKDNYIYVNRDNNPNFDADRALPYEIVVTSNIQGTYPSNHSDGVILNGTVHDLDPSISTVYKLNGAANWSTSNSTYVGDGRTYHPAVSATCTRNTQTDETKGIYNTSDGRTQYYDDASWSGAIKVTDNYDSTKTAQATCTITHAGTPSSPVSANFTFTVTPYNCEVENVSTATRGNNLPTFNYKENSFADGKDKKYWKETGTDGGKIDWDDWSNQMNIQDSIIDSVFDTETKYDNVEYGPYKTNTSSATWIRRKSGSIVHYYDWYYGVTVNCDNDNRLSEEFPHKGGSDSWTQTSNETMLYYLFVKWKDETSYHKETDLYRNASAIDATFRQNHSTFTDSWDWQVAKADGTDVLSSGSGSISITFKVSTTYKLVVSISGATSISCFSDGWSLTANVTAWHKNSGDSNWTQDSTPSISYSWSGAGSGSSSTCTISSDKVSYIGSDANSIGTTSAVKVTVSNDTYGTASASVNIGVYGISYEETVSINLNETLADNTKTITAFDDQTWTPSVTATHTVTAKSGPTETKDVTSEYNDPTVTWTSGSDTGSGTSHTLTAIQGTDANNTGTTSVTFTATGTCQEDKTDEVTAILKCYGKSYYNA